MDYTVYNQKLIDLLDNNTYEQISVQTLLNDFND